MSERSWSLMTKTRGGLVSILRDLTLDECKGAYQRLNPEYGYTWTTYESENGGVWSSQHSILNKDEIEMREVFGPPGWDVAEVHSWDEWPKRELIKLDDPRHPNNQKAAG